MAIENSHFFFYIIEIYGHYKIQSAYKSSNSNSLNDSPWKYLVIHWWYWIRDWLTWHTCARIFSEIEKASYLSGLYYHDYTVLKKTHDHSVPCCDFNIQFHAQLWFELPDFFYADSLFYAVSLDPLSISMYWKYNLKNYGSMLKHVIMDYFLK